MLSSRTALTLAAAAAALPIAAGIAQTPAPDTQWTVRGKQAGTHWGSRDHMAVLREGDIVYLAGGGTTSREIVRIDPASGRQLDSVQVTVATITTRIRAVGDVDGDGTGDYALLSPYAAGNAGQVELRSGVDHTVIATFKSQPGRVFGHDVVDAGDSNNDGRDEIFVSAIRDSQFGSPWVARYDVANPSNPEMWNYQRAGGAGFTMFGYDIDSFDLTGDGALDLIVGAPGTDVAGVGTQAGEVWFFDGPSGRPILGSWKGIEAGARLGTSVAVVVKPTETQGFYVGAGAPDADAPTDLGKEDAGALLIRDNNGGVTILYGTNAKDWFGTYVDRLSRLLIVSKIRVDNGGGVAIVDPGQPATLWESSPFADDFEHGTVSPWSSSLDSPSAGTLLIGAAGKDTIFGPDTGRVTALSLDPLSFSIDETEISLGLGGAQQMFIDGGAAAAGASYGVIGSASGPGSTPLLGLEIPIVFDWYTSIAAGWILSSVGTLDANGQATASLPIAANQFGPTFAGVELIHTAIWVSGSKLGTADCASVVRFVK